MSAEEGTISVLVLRALAFAGAALGHPLPALLRAADLPADALTPELLADADARASARIALRLWETLPRLAPDRAFGLWLAEQTKDAPFSVASWVLHTSPTLRQGIERAVRYQRLVHDASRGELFITNDEVVYRHVVGDAAFRVPRDAVEFGFASIVHLARRAIGRALVPARVSFRHSAPRDTEAHRAVFGERVAFDADHDEIAFAGAVLDVPLASREPGLHELVEAHARTLLARLPPPDASTRARVRALLADALLDGPPTLDDVAKKLALPRRTLQRKLANEGTRFDALLDDVRRDLAIGHLRDDGLSVQETAFVLGYSDVAAFHRAFVRWTGETPARFRLARKV